MPTHASTAGRCSSPSVWCGTTHRLAQPGMRLAIKETMVNHAPLFNESKRLLQLRNNVKGARVQCEQCSVQARNRGGVCGRKRCACKMKVVRCGLCGVPSVRPYVCSVWARIKLATRERVGVWGGGENYMRLVYQIGCVSRCSK